VFENRLEVVDDEVDDDADKDEDENLQIDRDTSLLLQRLQ